MKSAFELWGQLLREVKAAARGGHCLREFVTEALGNQLAHARMDEPPWMRGFGKLKHLHRETVLVQSAIDLEFDVIEPECRR
jgi:hypothetical protein